MQLALGLLVLAAGIVFFWFKGIKGMSWPDVFGQFSSKGKGTT